MPQVNTDDVRNPFEREVLKGLKALKRETRYKELSYETEKIPYTIEHVYVPDFVLIRADDTKLYVESKGYFDPVDRRKIKQIKKQNPELDIRIVFQKNNPISKGSKTRYTDWCGRIGIPCSVGSIPKDWLIS